MSIEPFILNDIEICNLDNKIRDLQIIFNELSYSHLPVEKDGVYLGCISDTDIRCLEGDKTLADYQYILDGFFAREDDHWLETLQTFALNQTNILPVLSHENKYLGYLELHDIINSFNETPFLNEPGGILVLEKGAREYSFSEVGQIVESHNAAMLGMFVSSKENDLTQITLKLSTTGLNEILQTFRRYGYTIVSDHQEDSFRENLRDRSDYLDKYLKM
ncbi:CBS domain-containing protein [Antarcticibacterium flavum]|uniref:CBS domain-containing protein n=1 Tax=Antarcticibacterium flavum TaxID=2058175 RepID=A0A5B7X4E6_9FLAO|nr:MULTISPECIES: CBS domain-containing protein [Antarcticibacterium]MCM4158389.1 acetoin utilization protein acuB [Antarcticibacterium sp. W02-3]QCY70150.1 CBS domain-containing protein [Antarcticibacterium flavum]